MLHSVSLAYQQFPWTPGESARGLMWTWLAKGGQHRPAGPSTSLYSTTNSFGDTVQYASLIAGSSEISLQGGRRSSMAGVNSLRIGCTVSLYRAPR